MNLKRALKLTAASFAVLLSCHIYAQEGRTFEKDMKEYSNSQKILIHFVNERLAMHSGSNGVYQWDANIQPLYDAARKSTINQERVEILAGILTIMGTQNTDGFNSFDDFLDDSILDKADYDDQQLLLVIAVAKQFDFVINKNHILPGEVRTLCQEKLTEFYDVELVPKVKRRFEDTEYETLVKDYLRLFPAEKENLIFNSGKGVVNNAKECTDLFTKAMAAYWELDRVSALANFPVWGRHMLNYLLLEFHPVMVDEFKEQMKNYKRSFKN